MHPALPDVSLYSPAAQALHAPPSGPVYPTLHLQSVRVVLPDALLVLGGHAVHAAADVAPVTVRYVPVGHLAHAAVPVTSLYLP